MRRKSRLAPTLGRMTLLGLGVGAYMMYNRNNKNQKNNQNSTNTSESQNMQ